MVQNVIIQPVLRVSLVILARLKPFVAGVTAEGYFAEITTRSLPFDEVRFTRKVACLLHQVFLAWLGHDLTVSVVRMYGKLQNI